MQLQMRDITKRIEVIQSLMSQGTKQALTYAALESRLTIELICYERLRISYDNITHDELRKWQPKDVLQQVVEEANEQADKSFTFSMSTTPVPDASRPTTKDEFESLEYVKIGEQAAVDLKRLGRLWNGLSGVALHVSLPKVKDNAISAYGDEQQIRKKVAETVREFEKLKNGNLLASSFGKICRFTCETCGFEVKRILDLLRHEQVVHCQNRSCNETYLVRLQDGEFFFSRRVVYPICKKCKKQFEIPLKIIDKLKFGEVRSVHCEACGEQNYLRFQLIQAIESNATVT